MLRSFNKHKNLERFQAEGDKFEDTHTWVVMDGNIIDPTPLKEANEWAIHFLKLEQTPTYEAYDDDTQKLFTEELIYRIVLEQKARGFIDCDYENPKYGRCYYNAWEFKKHNPTAKIVFGSVGYKFKKQRKNAKPKYFVLYGIMEGDDHSEDHLEKALQHARRKKDQYLFMLLLQFRQVASERHSQQNWGFAYKMSDLKDGTCYGQYVLLDDDE